MPGTDSVGRIPNVFSSRVNVTVVSETEAAWILETGATPVLQHGYG